MSHQGIAFDVYTDGTVMSKEGCDNYQQQDIERDLNELIWETVGQKPLAVYLESGHYEIINPHSFIPDRRANLHQVYYDGSNLGEVLNDYRGAVMAVFEPGVDFTAIKDKLDAVFGETYGDVHVLMLCSEKSMAYEIGEEFVKDRRQYNYLFPYEYVVAYNYAPYVDCYYYRCREYAKAETLVKGVGADGLMYAIRPFHNDVSDEWFCEIEKEAGCRKIMNRMKEIITQDQDATQRTEEELENDMAYWENMRKLTNLYRVEYDLGEAVEGEDGYEIYLYFPSKQVQRGQDKYDQKSFGLAQMLEGGKYHLGTSKYIGKYGNYYVAEFGFEVARLKPEVYVMLYEHVW